MLATYLSYVLINPNILYDENLGFCLLGSVRTLSKELLQILRALLHYKILHVFSTSEPPGKQTKWLYEVCSRMPRGLPSPEGLPDFLANVGSGPSYIEDAEFRGGLEFKML